MAKAVTNYDFLKQFELSTGGEYLSNIPAVTRANIVEVGNAIMDYQPAKDRFYNEFMVKITLQIFNSFEANNKFKFLKGENVVGDIEESYVDYIKGKNFDPEDETLLKNVKATIKNLYHKKNVEMVYETSISDAQLRNAFLSSNGLQSLSSKVVSALTESAEWDEYTLIKELIVDNFKHAGKVVKIPKTESAKENASLLMFHMKDYAGKLDYVSREYNKEGLANRTSKDNQLLVLHHDMDVQIDVSVLSNILNMEKLENNMQKVVVDNFNQDTNIIGAIIDKRAFRYHDELNQLETFRNPQTLTTKYFLHKWHLISMSYLLNTVYFVWDDEEVEATE